MFDLEKVKVEDLSDTIDWEVEEIEQGKHDDCLGEFMVHSLSWVRRAAARRLKEIQISQGNSQKSI